MIFLIIFGSTQSSPAHLNPYKKFILTRYPTRLTHPFSSEIPVMYLVCIDFFHDFIKYLDVCLTRFI
ncbi:hypothetical protein HanPSC8_Chr09g0395531 [Helianthus annuus]|nr:hypothetical protein HanPSC8_Chr09g0395531 [Helianthus annuus]